jgi:hypothetical protein
MSYDIRKKKLLSTKILQSKFFDEMRVFIGYEKLKFLLINEIFQPGNLINFLI